jgi:hypothetical protein
LRESRATPGHHHVVVAASQTKVEASVCS